jgi:hypothetical protein
MYVFLSILSLLRFHNILLQFALSFVFVLCCAVLCCIELLLTRVN